MFIVFILILDRKLYFSNLYSYTYTHTHTHTYIYIYFVKWYLLHWTLFIFKTFHNIHKWETCTVASMEVHRGFYISLPPCRWCSRYVLSIQLNGFKYFYQTLIILGRNLRGVIANLLESAIIGNEFEIHPRYYVDFWTLLSESMNPLNRHSSYGVNSSPTVFLQGGIWH